MMTKLKCKGMVLSFAVLFAVSGVFMFISLVSAESLPGVKVPGELTTGDTNLTWALFDANLGRGGYHQVSDLDARRAVKDPLTGLTADSLTAERRSPGMLVYVLSDGKTYRLKEDWDPDIVGTDADDNNWQEVSPAGGETDPIYTASAASGITGDNISNWDTAYGWGNHADAGYLTSYTETDPIYIASAAYNITGTNITNWNIAYTDNLKWDGGATGLVAATGRASLELGNVDNTSDADKPVSTAQQAALDLKAPLESPTFIGTVSGITKEMVGLENVNNTSDLNKPVSTEQQAALNLKAPLESPTFTGTVSGITKEMVGLGNVNNTSDIDKPISTAQQAGLNLKAPLESPTFTGTVSGITKEMVGLENVNNTSDIDKPISTAQQAALNLKAPLESPTFTGTVSIPFQKGTSEITRSGIGVTGQNMNADTVVAFLEKVFFPALPPGASLSATAPITREFGESQSLTLNWTATKTETDYPISSIDLAVVSGAGTIAELPITPTGETQNGSNSATSTGTITNMSDATTFRLIVTDSQAAKATADTTINWRHKRYWGVTNYKAADWPAEEMDFATFQEYAAPINSEFSTSKVKTGIALSPINQYIYYFYPTSFGVLGSGIALNGDFGYILITPVTISFTNASGGTTNFYLYVTPNYSTNEYSNICIK